MVLKGRSIQAILHPPQRSNLPQLLRMLRPVSFPAADTSFVGKESKFFGAANQDRPTRLSRPRRAGAVINQYQLIARPNSFTMPPHFATSDLK